MLERACAAVGLLLSLVATTTPAPPTPAPPGTPPDTMTIAGPVAGPGPVEIPDQRAASVTAFRHPDGARTIVLSSGPIRLRRGTDWLPIDLTLRRDPDGGVRPAAHPDTVWLSGGGRPADAAAVRGPDGSNIALPWNAPLPAPKLTGNRAVYPNARPGADLVIEVTRTGYVASLESTGGASGGRTPLPATGSHSPKPGARSVPGARPGSTGAPAPAASVPNPAAAMSAPATVPSAANPTPATVPSAANPTPAAATAPAAMPDPAAAVPNPAAANQATVPSAANPTPTPAPDAVPPSAVAEPAPPSVLPPTPMAEAPTSTPAAPTPAATPADPKAAALAGAPLTLRVTHPDGTSPDPATAASTSAADGQPGAAPALMAGPPGSLAARSVQSRVVANTTVPSQATLPFDTTVQNTMLSSDLSGDPDLKLGSYDGHSVARAYLSWDLSRLRGQKVVAASLRLYADWSSSCRPSGWEVWASQPVGPATRWANQPAADRAWASSTATLGHDAHCQPSWTSVNLTDLVKSWVAAGATSGTVLLRATNESDPASWKRFSSGAGENVPALGVTLAP
ncbi:MAG TPA: DNRLRE domain-containing protein [Pseudonocardia sp.]|nr:DNRLRE domain-containing protein [Pseudonocardia sp.]